MAFTAQDFEDGMSQLLPQGQVWEQFREQVHVLLRALSQEPARLAADAALALEAAIPDNANTDLDAFERIVGAPDTDLTDAERLARIQSLLFGRRHVSLGYLQDLVRVMAGDSNVVLFNRAYAPAAVGELNVGDSLAVGEWDATCLCELMAEAIAPMGDPDDFGAWTGFTAIAPASQNSPVTQAATAARVDLPDTAGRAFVDLDTDLLIAGKSAYLSIWIRSVAAPGVLNLEFLSRAGATSSMQFSVPADTWHKLSIEYPVGSGATTPRFQLFVDDDSNPTFDLSYACAGARDVALQDRISALFPIHTHVHYAVQGEFSPSLAQAPQYEEIL